MGIELTARYWRADDFEDQDGQQTLIASTCESCTDLRRVKRVGRGRGDHPPGG